MRFGPSRARVAAAAALLCVTAWTSRAALADAPDASRVVARVGDRTITVSELARRLGQVPAFQLRVFGDTPDAVRRNFLERVLVRELLFSEGARLRHLDERPDLADRIRAQLKNDLVNDVRTRARGERAITSEDVKAYYDKNASKFNSPARMSVWRIQVANEKDAAALIAEFKKDPSVKRWTDVARERSLDKSSYMRGGNVGYVAADGSTSEETTRLEPAAMAALARVKDGEIVPTPVREGDRVSVLWRRQTLRPVSRPLELETVPIRQILARKQTEDTLKALLDQLRASAGVTTQPEELDAFEIEPGGDLGVQRRPGSVARRPTVAQPRPGPAGR
ncbi:MAG TPA: peptidyl-prolyl cis-trans isomerase [Byssovorax sp.]|jgi:peptidyl-prolyl cis-trans isomerase C